jgi:hypothetical protein
MAEGEGFELAVRVVRRVVTQWRSQTNKEPLVEPHCRPALPITLSGLDVRRHRKNTVWKTVLIGASQTVEAVKSLKGLVGAPGLEPGTR